MASLIVSFAVLSLHCTVAGFRVYPPVNTSDSRLPLYFGLIQGINGSSGYQSPGAVAGVEVALDRINNDTNVLPGYSLHYVLTNAECDGTVSIEALFQQFLSDPVKVAIIGSGCSVATEPAAEISSFYNVTQISCIASSTELSDRIRFHKYFQILPTEADIAPAYFGVIRQFGWRHVALIVQQENLFTVSQLARFALACTPSTPIAAVFDHNLSLACHSRGADPGFLPPSPQRLTMDHLKMMLMNISVQFSEQTFPTDVGISALGSNPFNASERIYVFAMFSEHARQLLCEAHLRGYRYPRYLFLTYRWYSNNWWLMETENENLTCSQQERQGVLPSMLAFLHYPYLEFEGLNVVTDTGITGNQYLSEEEDHVMTPPLYLFSQEGGYFCYDAVWTLAYTLRRTMEDFAGISSLSKEAWQAFGIDINDTFLLENFTYSNGVVLNRMFNNMANTHFTGLTGPVSFREDGIRDLFTLRVFQYRYEEVNDSTTLDWFQIAHVEPHNASFHYLPGESDEKVWPRGIPYDGVPEEQDVPISVALTVVFSLLGTLGILFSLACLAFNFHFRNKILIRLSSPNLNILIGVGAIVLYVNLYLMVVPSTDPTVVAILCNLTPWFTAIGYSLCYGTILVKMARVYYILSNPTIERKKRLQDWVLGVYVGVMVGVDVVILVVYTAVEGSRGNLGAQRIPNLENMEDIEGELGIITRYFVWVCESTARDYFLGFLYGYKALLQVVALLLAFRTRTVKVKGLNDAKAIAATIYVSSIVLAVVIVAIYTLNMFVNAFAALFCTGFFIGTTVILAIVFIPKMVALYRDPEGRDVFRDAESSQSNNLANKLSAQLNVLGNPDNELMESLRRRVKELETKLSQHQEIEDTSNGVESSTTQFLKDSPIDEPEDMRAPHDQIHYNCYIDDNHNS